MKVLITGSSGLIGSALVEHLTNQGHCVFRLTRCGPGGPRPSWDPDNGRIDLGDMGPVDAVVHLAGMSIAAKRWTADSKAQITSSRTRGTRLLAETIARMDEKPKVLVSASGVGFYGDQGDSIVDETAVCGDGFLADLARKWEAAAAPAAEADIRVVYLRLGVVLSAAGGALKEMLGPFRMCMGGVIGSGKQYMSWVAIDDVVRIILHAINCGALSGPVNAVSPGASTNRQFTKALGRAIGRPTVARMPAFVARLIFGEMADELLLSSTRAVPKALNETGYSFLHTDLESALRSILGR